MKNYINLITIAKSFKQTLVFLEIIKNNLSNAKSTCEFSRDDFPQRLQVPVFYEWSWLLLE